MQYTKISLVMKLDNLDGNHGATNGIKLSCFRVGFTKPLTQFMPSAIRPAEGSHIGNFRTHCVYGAVQLLWLISIGMFDTTLRSLWLLSIYRTRLEGTIVINASYTDGRNSSLSDISMSRVLAKELGFPRFSGLFPKQMRIILILSIMVSLGQSHKLRSMKVSYSFPCALQIEEIYFSNGRL